MTIWNFSPRDTTPSSGLCSPYTHVVHRQTFRQAHIHINKARLFFKERQNFETNHCTGPGSASSGISVTWVANAASVIPSLSTPDADTHTCLHAPAYQQKRKYQSGLGFQSEPQVVSSASFWQRGMKEINVLASGRNITTVCLLQIFTLFTEIPAGTRAPIWTLLWGELIEMTEKLCLRTLWFYLWHTTPSSTKESSGRPRNHSYPHITSPPKQTLQNA